MSDKIDTSLPMEIHADYSIEALKVNRPIREHQDEDESDDILDDLQLVVMKAKDAATSLNKRRAAIMGDESRSELQRWEDVIKIADSRMNDILPRFDREHELTSKKIGLLQQSMKPDPMPSDQEVRQALRAMTKEQREAALKSADMAVASAMLNSPTPMLCGLSANRVGIFATDFAIKHHKSTLKRIERAHAAVELYDSASQAFLRHCSTIAPREQVKTMQARAAAAKKAMGD